MTTFTTIRPPAADADWQAWMAYGLALAAASPPHHAARPAPAWAPARATAGRTELALTLHAYREDRPGPRWQQLARATWPAYQRWFRSEGTGARPSYDDCRSALRHHLPELVPTWERLTQLAMDATGASRDEAGRLLSLWCPTPFVTGCSQVLVPGPDPALIRTYDYDPALFEGVIATTDYSGRRRVLGTSDCLWGLLDGINDAGLAVSLTYGGRPGRGTGSVGPGFGIPLVIRYLLETCAHVPAAVAVLRRVPVAQAYNIGLVDTAGRHATVFVAPGEDAEVSTQRIACNHRLDVVEHPHLAARLRSPERHAELIRLLARGTDEAGLSDAFLRPPLRSREYGAGFGSLYAVALRPGAGTVEYRWPGRTWTRRFDDPDEVITVEVPHEPTGPGFGERHACRGRGRHPRPRHDADS